MATLQELETALVNAHNAGDTQAATILAREIQGARALQGTPFEKNRARSEVIDRPAPDPLARLGRGFMDFADAGKQIGMARAPQDERTKFTRATDAEIADYEKGRGKEAGTFDVPRFVGGALPTLPIAGGMGMAAEKAAVGTLVHPLARAGMSAAQGAVQGALTYTPEGQSKAKQIALGSGAGVLAPFLSDAVSTVASKALQFGKGAAAKLAANPDTIIAELEPVLARQGVKWGDLAEEVKQGMIRQARQQMGVDGALDPDSLARKVEMDDVLGPAAGPTRGQVTRNSQEWSWERNTQKLPRVVGPDQEDLTDRFRNQLQILQDRVKALRAATGGTAANPYQAGASTSDAVKQKLAESKTVVDELYGAFRDSGAQGVEVKLPPVASALGRVVEEYGTEHIPKDVQNRLAEFGLLEAAGHGGGGGLGVKGSNKMFTVQDAEKLRKLITNNIVDDPRAKPQKAALLLLRNAIDDSVNATAEANPDMLRGARASAAARFAMRDQGGAVTAVAEGAEPDKLFQRFVLNGNVKDLQGLKATLNTGVMGGTPTAGMQGYEPAGAQAWKDLKGQVIEHAAQKAQAAGEGSFSGKAFVKALNEIGDERMKVLFDPKEIAELQKFARVAYNVTAEPPLAAVNHSNTAAAGAQYVRDAMRTVPALAEAATKVPFVGKMVAGAWNAGDEMAQKAAMRERVARALLGDAFNPDQANQKYRALAELISGRIGPYVGAAGVGGIEAKTR